MVWVTSWVLARVMLQRENMIWVALTNDATQGLKNVGLLVFSILTMLQLAIFSGSFFLDLQDRKGVYYPLLVILFPRLHKIKPITLFSTAEIMLPCHVPYFR